MKRIISILLVLMLLIVPASAGVIDDVNAAIDNGIKAFISSAKTLTFTSYASSVPVQIGYDKPTEMWVLAATIGWTKDKLMLVKLPANSVDTISGGEAAKARRDTTLTIDPKGSYEVASLTKFPIYFSRNSEANKRITDYYQVEGANWITTTVYDVSLNGQTQTVKVGMNYPADITLGQGAFIKNLGILSNGANAPSGDFVVIKNPDNNQWEFYRQSDVQTSLNFASANMPWKLFGDFTWQEIWTFLKDKGWLPPKPVMTASSYTFNPTTTASQGTIQMNYDRVAYSSSIVLYIPKALADTIIIQIGGSKAVITGKTDFKVSEGNTAQFSVTVRNDGGDDYVTVRATSTYYTINPVTKFMKTGDTEVFMMNAYALQIDSGDKSGLAVSVTADGTDPTNGDTTTTVYGTTYDTPTGKSTWKLTVIPKNPGGNIISDADVMIDGQKAFTGQGYVMKPRGTYQVTGGDVEGFYAPIPATVEIVDSDITKELRYTLSPPQADYTWVFWVALFSILVIAIYFTGLYKPILKQVIANPIALGYLIILIIILWLLWLLYQMVMGVSAAVTGMADSIANFRLW